MEAINLPEPTKDLENLVIEMPIADTPWFEWGEHELIESSASELGIDINDMQKTLQDCREYAKNHYNHMNPDSQAENDDFRLVEIDTRKDEKTRNSTFSIVLEGDDGERYDFFVKYFGETGEGLDSWMNERQTADMFRGEEISLVPFAWSRKIAIYDKARPFNKLLRDLKDKYDGEEGKERIKKALCDAARVILDFQRKGEAELEMKTKPKSRKSLIFRNRKQEDGLKSKDLSADLERFLKNTYKGKNTNSKELLERVIRERVTRPLQRQKKQFIHGDAYLGNFLEIKGKPLINDFELACKGPREYDLATLITGIDLHYYDKVHVAIDHAIKVMEGSGEKFDKKLFDTNVHRSIVSRGLYILGWLYENKEALTSVKDDDHDAKEEKERSLKAKATRLLEDVLSSAVVLDARHQYVNHKDRDTLSAILKYADDNLSDLIDIKDLRSRFKKYIPELKKRYSRLGMVMTAATAAFAALIGYFAHPDVYEVNMGGSATFEGPRSMGVREESHDYLADDYEEFPEGTIFEESEPRWGTGVEWENPDGTPAMKEPDRWECTTEYSRDPANPSRIVYHTDCIFRGSIGPNPIETEDPNDPDG